MLHILIVDPDPLVSMDIADAARRHRAGIGVIEVHDLTQARGVIGADQPVSHVFIRKPPSEREADALRFISDTSGKGATVVLVGADRRPDNLPEDLRLLCLGIPFTSDMLDALLWRMMPPE